MPFTFIVSDDKSWVNSTEVTLYVLSHDSLDAFKILSFWLSSLVLLCVWVCSSLHICILEFVELLRKINVIKKIYHVLGIISFSVFSVSYFFSFLPNNNNNNPIFCLLISLMLFHNPLRLCLFGFIFLPLCISDCVNSNDVLRVFWFLLLPAPTCS